MSIDPKTEYWKHCWNCNHETLQHRVGLEFFPRIVEMFSKEPEGPVKQKFWAVYYGSYSFTKCAKCSAPSLFVTEYWPKTDSIDEAKRISTEVKESGKSESGNFVQELVYPGFSSKPFPEWTHDLEEAYMVLFWEVYQAQSLGLSALAMMGVRTIVDMYATAKVGDIGGFSKKLEKLFSDRIISEDQHRLLNVVIDAGNATAHRGFRPDPEHVNSCMEVVEHLMLVEKFGGSIEQVRASTPDRPHNQKKQTDA